MREAIVNAICHRDYAYSSDITIGLFDDKVEISNPGTLPEPLTPEDLKRKHRSIPRNPLIAKCFFLIKYIEQWGTGTNDMIAACINWSLPEPELELATGDLVVTIRTDIYTEDYLKTLGLNERQIKAIEYLKMNKTLTSKKYAELFSVTERTARNDLKELINKRVIERKGVSDKTTYYILAEI